MNGRADGVAGTRERIARGALALILEHWFEDVTLADIARAGEVSHQTVLNHFGSKEGAVRAAIEVLGQETMQRRAAAVPGDVHGAVHVLVGEYERFGDSNTRWAVSSERLGSLAPLLDEAMAAHQAWLEQVFGPRLPTQQAARRLAVTALHVATDVYTWKLLRRHLRLGRGETERTMVELVAGVLARIAEEDR
ncbi:MAG TPA: TetR/AcrR family transcriptional regulator [Pseudonocardia sp.]|jgi:AcrR family transcriptional regulator|nr:TetR/AcrR family transcriptional regulator [Pseudonocardia sp.]